MYLTIHVDDIKQLLAQVHYSEAGSSERVKEEATYMLFLDFLYDCEGNHSLMMSECYCMLPMLTYRE